MMSKRMRRVLLQLWYTALLLAVQTGVTETMRSVALGFLVLLHQGDQTYQISKKRQDLGRLESRGWTLIQICTYTLQFAPITSGVVHLISCIMRILWTGLLHLS